MQLESNHHVEQANIMMAKSRNIIDDQATSHSFIWCCCFKSWSPKLPLVQSLFFSFRVVVSKIFITILTHIFAWNMIQAPTTDHNSFVGCQTDMRKVAPLDVESQVGRAEVTEVFLREIIRRLVDRCFTKDCWEKWYNYIIRIYIYMYVIVRIITYIYNAMILHDEGLECN